MSWLNLSNLSKKITSLWYDYSKNEFAPQAQQNANWISPGEEDVTSLMKGEQG